jgi:hypothetical protein
LANVLLSYRRLDSDVIAGRIRDRLANHFGNNSVYMDIDSVPFGIDFREHIKEAVIQNDVLVAVIGPNWSGQANNSRLVDETDPVRLEIETALKGGIPVIPVLVSGATMPKAAELPDGMKDLAFRNAATVDGGRDFHQHMDRLIRSMDKLLADKQTVRKSSLNLDGAVTAQKGKKDSRLLGQVFIGVSAAFAVAVWLVYLLFSERAPHQQVQIQQEHNLQQQQAQQQPPQQQAQQQPPQQAEFPAMPPPCTKSSTGNAFYDNFKTEEFGWSPPIGPTRNAGDTTYNGGRLELTPRVSYFLMEVYALRTFGNVNVCARIMNPPNQAPANAGVLFWFQDRSNFFRVALYLDSTSIQIHRLANGLWLYVGKTPAPDMNTQPSAINEIQVVTKGNLGAEYLNGRKVGEFRGQPLAQGPVGILAASESQEKSTWRFLEFSASEYQ